MRQIGKVVLNIAPTKHNPRNSEGAFLDLDDGRIMFAYSSFVGATNDDDANANIVARYSHDGGFTWSDEVALATATEHEALNIMSVSLLRMTNGDIGLFYLIRRGWHDVRLHLRRSSDNGITWGEAICCVPALGDYTTNNDRIIRTSSGRLIAPASFNRMKGSSTTAWDAHDPRGVVYFYLSDDDGYSWREAKTNVMVDEPRTNSGLQEPGVVELADGTLWSWSRTDLGWQYQTFSRDGGETWTRSTISPFTSPRSPLSLKRITANGRLFAVWNPIPNYQTRILTPGTGGRTPLVGAFSDDEGKTWGDFVVFEREEDRNGCCYTAIHMLDDAILLGYNAGDEDDGGCLGRLKIRRIELAELKA